MSKSNSTTGLKLSYNNEVHRVASRPQDLRSLLKSVNEVFPDLSKEASSQRVYLKYEDAEGDMIVIATEDDYQTALVSSDSEKKSLKIFVTSDFNDGISSSSIILKASELEEEPKKPESNKRDEVIIEEEKPEQVVQETEILVSKEVQNEANQTEANQKVEEAVNTNDQPVHQGEHFHRHHFHQHHHQFRRHHKLNMLRNLTKEVLQEEIPTIAMIVKQMLEDPSAQSKPQPQSQSSTSKAVHHGVRCDGCSMYPIVGIRYKCTVHPDYDLCENCEAKDEHPYPLLKLRHNAQRAVRVSAVLAPQHQGNPERRHPGRCPRAHAHVHDSKKQENRSPQHCHGIRKVMGELLQQVHKPEEIKKRLHEAFETGNHVARVAFEDLKSKLESLNTKMQEAPVAEKNSKEETKQEAPKAESPKTEKTNIEEKSPKTTKNDVIFVEQPSQPSEVEKIQKVEEPVKEEKYAADVLEKAKMVVDIFPQCKLEDVCEVVKQFPKKPVEQLVQEFLGSF